MPKATQFPKMPLHLKSKKESKITSQKGQNSLKVHPKAFLLGSILPKLKRQKLTVIPKKKAVKLREEEQMITHRQRKASPRRPK